TINAIMSSYAEELEFSSPKIRAILGENKNYTISSKRELSTYFSAGLERFPNLKFKIIDFTVSNDKVILEYSANLDGKSIVNVFEKELVKKSGAYYGVEQSTD
ncbi:MAG: nuclear transport factor 2 family protein, partial [Nitrososphaeraceae archaeon]